MNDGWTWRNAIQKDGKKYIEGRHSALHCDIHLNGEGTSTSFWLPKRVAIHNADCLEIIPSLVAAGTTVDSVVTDPPYHLTATLARFGKIDINANTATSTRLRKKLDGAARLAHGFMNQQWDGGDTAFRPETWATIATVLRPGGYLLAFGGTRTYHRMACAIEDAGFVIQDCVMWLYGSGFPKRRDMLKPAYEPILLAYKPGGKRTMQVDECRVPSATPVPRGTTHTRAAPANGDARNYGKGSGSWEQGRTFTVSDDPMLGRWPANVCHDGSDEAVAAFPESQSTKNGGKTERNSHLTEEWWGQGGGGFRGGRSTVAHGDSGSAARFFYSSKAGIEDRAGSTHPTVKPVNLMRWLVRLVTPPGGTVLDPFAGSGTVGAAAYSEQRSAILIDSDPTSIADIHERMEFYKDPSLITDIHERMGFYEGKSLPAKRGVKRLRRAHLNDFGSEPVLPPLKGYLPNEKFTSTSEAIKWVESFANPLDIYNNFCNAPIPTEMETLSDANLPKPKFQQRKFFSAET